MENITLEVAVKNLVKLDNTKVSGNMVGGILEQWTNIKKAGRETNVRVGTWNAWTLLVTGKMKVAAWEMVEYKFKFFTLQETRWNGSGKVDLSDELQWREYSR